MLSTLFFSLSIAIPASAENYDCTNAAPTCLSLGYEQKAEDCKGLPTLACPFNPANVYCGGERSSASNSKSATQSNEGNSLPTDGEE